MSLLGEYKNKKFHLLAFMSSEIMVNSGNTNTKQIQNLIHQFAIQSVEDYEDED